MVLKNKIGDVGRKKYFPSFSKEWKNIIYSYNKNNLKNIPVNIVNINKIIQSYFNLYFKYFKYVGSNKFELANFRLRSIPFRKIRNFLRRIYVSNVEIKHTNNKAIISLYIVNREKKILKKKYLKIYKKVSRNLIKRYFLLYKKNIVKILNKHKPRYDFISIAAASCPSIRKFIYYKLEYLNKFIKLKNIYLEKIINIINEKRKKRYLKSLRKYDLIYSLNQYKFNKKIFLPILSKILNKIIGKKIEYNMISLKSVTCNTDIFTNALALKFKKDRFNLKLSILSLLNRANMPIIQIMEKRERALGGKKAEWGCLVAEFKDLKTISNLSRNNLSELLKNLSSKKETHSTIYNSIRYKSIGGIRLKVKGRLTKRNKANRPLSLVRWRGGGLRNVDSLSTLLSSVSFRGNFKSNVSYSLFNSKRRIGAFAVKGWISGIS
uniref:ribosomal protein S3 n=1 Tax=Paraisaria gracilioides TaxID=2651847 RepID=UPI0023D81734|nr:ribosomal protein S3 [Paraisaria gracilioides]WDE74384.1 ribosomal protein S3 [Paraisaria gracilioides]